MKQVTQDEWTDFSSDYRCVATDNPCEGVAYINLNHHQTKELISQVLYFSNGAKEYWINEECTAPKTVYFVDEDGVARHKEV